MQSKFESYIKDNLPFLFKERSIVCCSGGIDSIVLFHLMFSINKNFVVAHCNFKLRADESDLDEKFVKTLCKKYLDDTGMHFIYYMSSDFYTFCVRSF